MGQRPNTPKEKDLRKIATAVVVSTLFGLAVAGQAAADEITELEGAQVGVPVPLPVNVVEYWFDNGFKLIADEAPDKVGAPVSRELPGDVPDTIIQKTTTGLLYYKGPGNPVTWTNGFDRASLINGKLIEWADTEASDPPVPKPVASPSGSGPAAGGQPYGVFDRLAECESGGNWHVDAYHDGGLQFLPSTWLAYGGGKYAPYAYMATREQQIAIAQKVQAAAGWGQWPVCSRRIGLR